MEGHTIKVTEFGKEPVVYDTQTKESSRGGHGGGDMGLIESVIDFFANNKTSKAITYIDKSIESHFVALAADYSRLNGGELIDMEEWMNRF
jgi:hypothetical protein